MKCTVQDQGLFTKVISTKMESSRLGELNSGPTAEGTKVNGKTALRTGKGGFGMQMATHTKVFGVTIRQMDLVFINMRTGPVIWDTGKTMSNTDGDRKLGPMALVSKETTWMEKNTGRVFTIGPMGQAMMEAGLKTKSMDMGFTSGQTIANLLAIGKTITCMVLANMSGQMEGAMKEATKMIRSMGTAYTLGRMVASTRASGSTENNTVKARTGTQTVMLGRAFG